VSAGKVLDSFAEAVADIEDRATVIVGGFGLSGIPEKAIAALREKGSRELVIVSNNCGVDDFGLGILLANNQVAKMVASYVGENKIFEQQYLSGELEVELVPQGTLAERMRAAGAGIPGFYTATGVGTPVAEGKEAKEFDGRTYLLERALGGDFALVKAWKGDSLGNLVYRETARNFNPLAAMAGKVTIAEVEELVEVGELDPDHVHTPGIFVQRILEGSGYEKRIERRTVRERTGDLEGGGASAGRH
jgi:3-oxoacid CoA-transferase subunit A